MLLVSYLCAGKPSVAEPSTRMDFPQLAVIGSLGNLRSSTRERQSGTGKASRLLSGIPGAQPRTALASIVEMSS